MISLSDTSGQNNRFVGSNKNYKQSEVGIIPDEWSVLALGKLGSWKGGGTPSKRVNMYWNGSIPWVSPKDFTGATISDTEDHITTEAIENSSTALIQKDSILIVVRSGILRKFVPIARNLVDVAINQDLKALTVSQDYDVEFVVQTLKAFATKIKENTVKVGTTVESIDFNALKNFIIPLPPLSEQRKIAEIISSWDEAISKTEKLIAALSARKKGLIQRLLTGEIRFPGFDGDWRETELGEFFYPFSKKNSANEDLTVLSCSTIHGIVPQTVIFGKRIASEDIRRYKVVERGDLVYDPMLLWDASIGFLEVAERGVISPAYSTFKFRKKSSNWEYFKYLLKTHYYRQHYKYISQGTNVRRRKAPVEAFLKLAVKLPATIEEQNKIVDTLKAGDLEIELLSKKLEALKQQKKGLMQRLLTGRVRVKV